MEQYTVITALGNLETSRHDLAMRVCVCAINSGLTPYAAIHDAATDASNEFYIPECDSVLE